MSSDVLLDSQLQQEEAGVAGIHSSKHVNLITQYPASGYILSGIAFASYIVS